MNGNFSSEPLAIMGNAQSYPQVGGAPVAGGTYPGYQARTNALHGHLMQSPNPRAALQQQRGRMWAGDQPTVASYAAQHALSGPQAAMARNVGQQFADYAPSMNPAAHGPEVLGHTGQGTLYQQQVQAQTNMSMRRDQSTSLGAPYQSAFQ